MRCNSAGVTGSSCRCWRCSQIIASIAAVCELDRQAPMVKRLESRCREKLLLISRTICASSRSCRTNREQRPPARITEIKSNPKASSRRSHPGPIHPIKRRECSRWGKYTWERRISIRGGSAATRFAGDSEGTGNSRKDCRIISKAGWGSIPPIIATHIFSG